MLVPYTYRGFNINGFYHKPGEDKAFSIFVETPNQKSWQCIAKGVEDWELAKELAETAIDEAIAAWN